MSSAGRRAVRSALFHLRAATCGHAVHIQPAGMLRSCYTQLLHETSACGAAAAALDVAALAVPSGSGRGVIDGNGQRLGRSTPVGSFYYGVAAPAGPWQAMHREAPAPGCNASASLPLGLFLQAQGITALPALGAVAAALHNGSRAGAPLHWQGWPLAAQGAIFPLSVPLGEDVGELHRPAPLYADSVKRKRKLKIKRHKHRKRMKKLRQGK